METVETAVTTTLERQINGVEGMQYMTSNSSAGSSQISVYFESQTDKNIDQVNVQNRLARATPRLPTTVQQFGVTAQTSSTSILLVYALYPQNNEYDALFISNYIDLNLRDQLLRTPGVGDLTIFGEKQYAMRLWLDPNALAGRGLTVTDVATALRSQVVPKIGEYFAAKRWRIFFFEQLPLADSNQHKILKIALSTEHNPVARYLVEHHAPVHEALVTSPKAWKIICPRPDHWHVMAGPIVNRNKLVGVVGCTREKSMPAFDTQNLSDLSAICLHLSVWATTVGSQAIYEGKLQHQPFKTDRLTPRELQIAELVALGQTNAEIGYQLWITENSVKQALKRMFRKLEVSSRAEMVAQLLAPRHHSLVANPDL